MSFLSGKWYPSGHGHCIASYVQSTHHHKFLDAFLIAVELSSCHGFGCVVLLPTQVELAYFDGILSCQTEYGTFTVVISLRGYALLLPSTLGNP
jgi:hypothetical protein